MKDKIMKLKENRFVTRMMPLVFILILVSFFSIRTNGRFSELRNLRIILEQALIMATVATGAVFIFATGNINIAMGASTALIATLSSLLYLKTNSIVIMIGAAILLGVALMIICALLSTVLRVSVMYVTIVMMTLLVSIQQTIIGGSTVMLPFEMTNGLKNINFNYILFGLFFLLCLVLFNFTTIGRKLKFHGTNQQCATQTGIRKDRVLIIAFAVAGIGVGCGALMTIVRTGAISITTAGSLNMDCMLAMVLGGMSVFGGSKSFVYSATFGAFLVAVLNNGLLMIGVSATILQGIRGIIFLLLVCLSQKRPKGLPAPQY